MSNTSHLALPPIVFGTSSLGNLYQAMPFETKLEIIKQSIDHTPGIPVFDSAGKYGAGLALEVLQQGLSKLNVHPDNVIISNKLGWYRVPLTTPEPTFEKGVWVGIKHDAVQKISYDGILECYQQGNELLGAYTPQMVSVHDPDEYVAKATSNEEYDILYQDILQAYKALIELKKAGKVQSIGVGAKSWKIIEKIAKDVKLDWVMIANSFTIKTHPKELMHFMEQLKMQQVQIINSAVFHGGFLLSGDHYDYQLLNKDDEAHKAIFKWRADFFALCEKYKISPAAAGVQFALSAPGVQSIALSTSHPNRVKENVHLTTVKIPAEFWSDMKAAGLIQAYYNFI